MRMHISLKKKNIYKVGICNFPFIQYNNKIVNPLTNISPLIKINFECEKGNIKKGSWCYVNTNKNNKIENSIREDNIKEDNIINKNKDKKNKLNENYRKKDYKNKLNTEEDITLLKNLKGTNDINNIYYGEWFFDDYVTDNNKIDIKKIKNKNKLMTEGFCSINLNTNKQKKIEDKLELNNVTKIKLDKYNKEKCLLSPSKGGYTRKELYLFGRNELSLPYTLLINKDNKILSKNNLCKIFNNKILDRIKDDLPEESFDTKLKKYYIKEPINCQEGPKRGGYKLTELRNILVTYFNLDITEADDMNKVELCKYLNTEIKKNLIKPENLDENIYPDNLNIKYCSYPESSGGISKKKLQEIINNNLDIDIKGKNKKELCDLIYNHIQNMKLKKNNLDNNISIYSTNNDNNKKNNLLNSKKIDPELLDKTIIKSKIKEKKTLKPNDIDKIKI